MREQHHRTNNLPGAAVEFEGFHGIAEVSRVANVHLAKSIGIEARRQESVAVSQPNDPRVLDALMAGGGLDDVLGSPRIYDTHLFVLAGRGEQCAVLLPTDRLDDVLVLVVGCWSTKFNK